MNHWKVTPTVMFLLGGLLFTGSTLELAAQQGGLGVFRTRTGVMKLKEYPAQPKGAPIEVLGSAPKDREHEDVCVITAKGGQTIFNAKSAEKLLETIKNDARKCGANAIIIQGAEDRAWKPFQGGVTQSQATVLAIRFIDN